MWLRVCHPISLFDSCVSCSLCRPCATSYSWHDGGCAVPRERLASHDSDGHSRRVNRVIFFFIHVDDGLCLNYT